MEHNIALQRRVNEKSVTFKRVADTNRKIEMGPDNKINEGNKSSYIGYIMTANSFPSSVKSKR